uniref:Uncharacterized protein n=1 Tax=Escherichia coli TaxID=562 RepID=A0A8F1IES2_ECOLX|nr:hypothetical protein IHCLGBEB_00009 [Escherichia coli]
MMCKPCTGVFLRSGTFIYLYANLHSWDVTRPAATAPLPADRPPGVPPCLLYSITADRCCRLDAPQNPHGRPDTLCRSVAPPDQWQKCHLRADLLPGPAAVRRLLSHAVLPGGGPVLPAVGCATAHWRPSALLPAAGSERAGYAASRHPPDDGRRRAGLARGFPASLQHPFYVPRQHGSWPFFIKGSQQ